MTWALSDWVTWLFASVCFKVNKRLIPVRFDPTFKWIRLSVDSEVNRFTGFRSEYGRENGCSQQRWAYVWAAERHHVYCKRLRAVNTDKPLTWCSLKTYWGWDEGSLAVYADITVSPSIDVVWSVSHLATDDTDADVEWQPGWEWERPFGISKTVKMKRLLVNALCCLVLWCYVLYFTAPSDIAIWISLYGCAMTNKVYLILSCWACTATHMLNLYTYTLHIVTTEIITLPQKAFLSNKLILKSNIEIVKGCCG